MSCFVNSAPSRPPPSCFRSHARSPSLSAQGSLLRNGRAQGSFIGEVKTSSPNLNARKTSASNPGASMRDLASSRARGESLPSSPHGQVDRDEASDLSQAQVCVPKESCKVSKRAL